jgi:lipopolysaccharide export system protein LptC
MALELQKEGAWREQAVNERAREARTARAFHSAARHSLLVRRLRVALLAGALVAIAAIAAIMVLRSFTRHFGDFSIADMSVDGAKINMDKPRLTGARPDGSSYVLTADRAIQDITRPNEVDLVNIAGDIGSRDRANVKIKADKGHYNNEKGIMNLSGAVRLSSVEYQIDMKSVDIDFKGGVYETHEPIEVVTSSGMTIVADGGSASQNATEIMFTGHVKTTIPPGGAGSDAAAEMKGNQP